MDDLPPEKIEAMLQAAFAGLQSNTRQLFDFPHPVLIEGGEYQGIWLEGGPHQSLLYAEFDAEIAKAGHEIFFHHQRVDGYIPCAIFENRVITGQIQGVVPLARTSWELAQQSKDEAFLSSAYKACRRYDAWLAANRNTRGTGCIEMFCEFDSGHDRSPRIAGLPEQCPQQNPGRCPDISGLPYLAPDMSATVYGGRLALAGMAEALGLPDEAAEWLEKGETLRKAILDNCFDAEDEFFYDVDAFGHFRKFRGDAITRVFSEGVVDAALFEKIYARYIRNPAEFWTPFPFPSISPADPSYLCTIDRNSWDGPSMALTALRAPRWMERYGKKDDLLRLMQTWLKAIVRAEAFYQQLHPFEGYMKVSQGYSPAMFVLIDFTGRLGLRLAGERHCCNRTPA